MRPRVTALRWWSCRRTARRAGLQLAGTVIDHQVNRTWRSRAGIRVPGRITIPGCMARIGDGLPKKDDGRREGPASVILWASASAWFRLWTFRAPALVRRLPFETRASDRSRPFRGSGMARAAGRFVTTVARARSGLHVDAPWTDGKALAFEAPNSRSESGPGFVTSGTGRGFRAARTVYRTLRALQHRGGGAVGTEPARTSAGCGE